MVATAAAVASVGWISQFQISLHAGSIYRTCLTGQTLTCTGAQSPMTRRVYTFSRCPRLLVNSAVNLHSGEEAAYASHRYWGRGRICKVTNRSSLYILLRGMYSNTNYSKSKSKPIFYIFHTIYKQLEHQTDCRMLSYIITNQTSKPKPTIVLRGQLKTFLLSLPLALKVLENVLLVHKYRWFHAASKGQTV